jgi:DNA-binding response OmpR family regulator
MICPCCNQPANALKLSQAITTFTATELKVIESLERRRVAAMHAIVDDVWGDDINGGPEDTRTNINVHLSRIRKKLRSAGIPYTVRNLWGVGYKLERVG